jgi:predicted nucleotidyltransferase
VSVGIHLRSNPGRLREVRVFGSVARGEADEHSDVDVLVVFEQIQSHGEPCEVA